MPLALPRLPSLLILLAYPASSNRTFTHGFSSGKSAVVFNVETHQDFVDKVVNSTVPVLAFFYDDFCEPCQWLRPSLEAKVERLNGSILLAEVNVDTADDLEMELEILEVPTVMAFKNGEMVRRVEGDQSDEYFDELFQSLLGE